MANTFEIFRIVVMGVCGCGKSTIGKALADELGMDFKDGDELHPDANIRKMSQGIALQDEDRWPWLEKVGRVLDENQLMVIACSALKKTYRDHIRQFAGGAVLFVHLHGNRAVLTERMKLRQAHFMPDSLLDSQLETLEVPHNDELALTVEIDAKVDEIVSAIVKKIHNLDANHLSPIGQDKKAAT